MHLVPQTLLYKIWLCSSLTKLKTSSIEYVLMILVGSYTQCVTGVLPPQKQLQSESLAKLFNTLSYIQLYQNARILEMIPAESQKIPTESLEVQCVTSYANKPILSIIFKIQHLNEHPARFNLLFSFCHDVFRVQWMRKALICNICR